MKNTKIIGIVVVAIILIAVISIIVVMGGSKKTDNVEKKSEDIVLTEDEKSTLKSEIDSLNLKIQEKNSMDSKEVTDILDREILSGYAGKFEKAAKDYIKKANTSLWNISESFSDEKLAGLLTVENIKKDGPDFNESISYILEAKKDVEEKFMETSNYLEPSHIDDYYTKMNLGEKNRDFFRELILQGNDYLRNVTSTSITEAMHEATNLIEQEQKIFELLRENKDKWSIKDDVLKFSDSKVESKYVEIMTKMK